jgi:hypothetical protein
VMVRSCAERAARAPKVKQASFAKTCLMGVMIYEPDFIYEQTLPMSFEARQDRASR